MSRRRAMVSQWSVLVSVIDDAGNNGVTPYCHEKVLFAGKVLAVLNSRLGNSGHSKKGKAMLSAEKTKTECLSRPNFTPHLDFCRQYCIVIKMNTHSNWPKSRVLNLGGRTCSSFGPVAKSGKLDIFIAY
jgi:hypothetical protein